MAAASAEFKQEQQGAALAVRTKSGGDAVPWNISEKSKVQDEIKLMSKPPHELSSAEVKTIRERYDEIVRKEQWSGAGQSGISVEDQAVAQKFKESYGRLKGSWSDQDSVALAERQNRLVRPVRTTANNDGQAQNLVNTRAATNFEADSLVVRRSLTPDVFPSRSLDEPHVRYYPVIRSRTQMAITNSTFGRWGIRTTPEQLGRFNVMTSIDGHSLKNAGFNVEEVRTFLQSIHPAARQQIMQSDDQGAKQLIEALENHVKQQRAGEL
jgi:hypothetical protein